MKINRKEVLRKR